MKGKLAKKRFLSMQPDFAYLNAGASRRRLGNLRTRLGTAILLLILLAIFLVPAFVPYGYAQIITVDGQRDRGKAERAGARERDARRAHFFSSARMREISISRSASRVAQLVQSRTALCSASIRC